MAIADSRMTGTEVVHKSHMIVGVFKRCNIEALKSLQSAYYISKPHGLRMSIKFVLCFALYTIYTDISTMMTSSNGDTFRVTGPLFVCVCVCGGRGVHRSPVNSPHKGQWRGILMFSLIRPWINGWVNTREACDLRRHNTHYDVTLMNPCANHIVDAVVEFGHLPWWHHDMNTLSVWPFVTGI